VRKYTEEIFQLTEKVARQERVLDAVHRFEKEGGRYRMSIHVDHGDYTMKEAIEALAREHFPGETLLKGLAKWALDDLQAAKEQLQAAVMADAPAVEVRP
jgi:hypothetical protein